MRIKVVEKGKTRFSFRLPTRLFLNGFSASLFPLFINAKLRKSGVKISGRMCRKFVRGFNKVKKKFENLELIDVETKSGDSVKISI